MKAAVVVVVVGVILAIVGAVNWSKAAAARADARSTAEWAEAYGWKQAAVSSDAVYIGVGILAFGAVVMLTGVALAISKARA